MMNKAWALAIVATSVGTVWAQAPRMTPRGSEVRVYPAPAVTPVPAGQALGPYSVGLAAAAPVGTPYLRSPAFAGPPIIYMPQTVTRVLVPASTPYPGNVMPATQYVYASAPFLRTDIYVSLPYGTYFWPRGYAGVQPVAPSLPVYVEAPATAILSAEGQYAAARYQAGSAAAESAGSATEAVTPTPKTAEAIPSKEMVIVPETVREKPPAAATPAVAPKETPKETPAEKSPFSPEVKVPALTPAVAPPPLATPTPAAPPPPSQPATLPPLTPLAPPAPTPEPQK